MLYLGSDHAGVELKEAVRVYCDKNTIAYTDFGAHNTDSVDFPQYAFQVAESVAREKDSLGVLFCGSGIGVSIAANKVSGARAALALNTYMAAQSREHDDANILVLAGRILTQSQAIDIFESFMRARFDNGTHHVRRVQQIIDYEHKHILL